MKTAEIYKLRTHRTPIVCAAVLLIGVLIPSVVLIWYTPSDPSSYSAFSDVFETLSLVLAIVFGGWLLGTEYRQGTVKRLLTSEPRRIRALGTKAAVGASAMAGVLAATAGIGWAAARLVGSMNDQTVAFEGRALLAFSLSALFAATVAYSLSAVTRSDAFAMVGTVVVILVLGPLLSLIPKVGQYTLFSALVTVEEWVGGLPADGLVELSNGAALITLVVWLGVFLTGGVVLFAKRDV